MPGNVHRVPWQQVKSSSQSAVVWQGPPGVTVGDPVQDSVDSPEQAWKMALSSWVQTTLRPSVQVKVMPLVSLFSWKPTLSLCPLGSETVIRLDTWLPA